MVGNNFLLLFVLFRKCEQVDFLFFCILFLSVNVFNMEKLYIVCIAYSAHRGKINKRKKKKKKRKKKVTDIDIHIIYTCWLCFFLSLCNLENLYIKCFRNEALQYFCLVDIYSTSHTSTFSLLVEK